MKSVVIFKENLLPEADRRICPVYKPPHDIKDRETWVNYSRQTYHKDPKHLQEAVNWWEQEQQKLAQLFDSLQSNHDDMKQSEKALTAIYDASLAWRSVSKPLFIVWVVMFGPSVLTTAPIIVPPCGRIQ